MIRTFHAKADPVLLIGCLLPVTVLAVYFFWVWLPIPAAVCMLLMILIVERTIHASYVFTDDGRLWIHKGRFSKTIYLDLQDICQVEVRHVRYFFLVKKREVVWLTTQDGREWILTPFPAAEFCRVLKKRKQELCNK